MAAGVSPASPPERKVRLSDGTERSLKFTRNPSPDELLQIEDEFSTTSLDQAQFDEWLRRTEWPFLKPPLQPTTIWIAEMTRPSEAIACCVAIECVADFLNDVGQLAVDADIDDVQFSLCEGDEKIGHFTGVTLDIDDKVADPATLHIQNGARAANVVFSTERGGARLLYLFDAEQEANDETIRKLGFLQDELNVSYDGVDPRLSSFSQRQHLPTVWRTTKGPRRLVQHTASQLEFRGVAFADLSPTAPWRLLNALDLVGDGVSPAERRIVEDYLSSLGIPAGPENRLYATCPHKAHSAAKTYVNRSADGRISVYCLGGHDGAGPLSWSEAELLELAQQGGRP